jgi:hypothetical protein
MKATPGFIIASILCAAPFALAVRDEIKGRPHMDPGGPFGIDDDDDDDYGYGSRDYGDDDSYGGTDRDDLEEYAKQRMAQIEAEQAALEAARSTSIKADDLDAIVGTDPASMGTLLANLQIGSSSLNFQSESARERIEAYKAEHNVRVDYDFDDVSLNGVTVEAVGDEETLRDALISRWGTPVRLGEDELVWMGANEIRAVYTTMYDGFRLRFEAYTPVDKAIAPDDKSKLGFEPFPLVGASMEKVDAAIGARLQENYDNEWTMFLPGIGAGSGKTEVTIGADASGRKVVTMVIAGSTNDTDAVREAFIAKWGTPKEGDYGEMTWKKNGVKISLELQDRGFFLREEK